HACSVIPDRDPDSSILPASRQKNPSLPFDAPDTVTDGIFHDGLQNHAGNFHIQKFLVHSAAEMNLPAEAYIHDIQITVHQLQLFPEGSLLIDLLYVITEEIRHIPHEKAGPLRALHHGKLSA